MAHGAFASTSRILLTTAKREADRQRLAQKVSRMAALPVGWSCGEGIPVLESAILCAEEFISWGVILDLSVDVFPNPDGGCAVAFYKEEDSVEVSIDPAGVHFTLRVERGVGFKFTDVIPPKDNATLDEILEQLVQLQMLGQTIWKLFASSISATSTEQRGDSAMSYIETQQDQQIPLLLQTAEGGSQSSRPLALAEI